MRWLLAFAAAVCAYAAERPLYVFDNGLGRGELSIDEQVALAKETGYAGVFYSGTKDIPQVLAAQASRGIKLLGIYTGMNLSDATPSYEPGLADAIQQMRGTGALITVTVSGKAPDGDSVAVPIIRKVADMASEAGLKVALYPHHGFHMARIEDSLRLIDKVGRKNVGLVFNLCHWLRSGDEPNFNTRLTEALPHTMMVSINGADHEGDWDRLIQTLDRGAFDVKSFLKAFGARGYRGPIALQCYNVKGDRKENLTRSMKAWRSMQN